MSDRPETLYDLCEEVCVSIKESPANYYQEQYVKDGSKLGTCGTAFCRAGWMCAVLDAGKVQRNWVQWATAGVPSRAKNLLLRAGIDNTDVNRLFNCGACWPHLYGTESYVQNGIAGMRKFMADHEAKLKAYKITEDD